MAYLEIRDRESVRKLKLQNNMTIGRTSSTSSPDIPFKEIFVSRRHGLLQQTERGLFYTDTGSTNGSWLNGVKLQPKLPQLLTDGDSLMFCNCRDSSAANAFVTMTLHSESNEETTTMQHTRFVNNEFHLPSLHIRLRERRAGRKVLLKDVNIDIPSGKVVLFLGGSGAGKTTLMNAVCGYEKADADITYGQYNIYEDYEMVKHLVSYVPQQDLVRMKDTVYKTLVNAADMRLANMPKAVRAARVEKALNLLGLGPQRDSLVSKISGGQLKRLSIGLEYVADPKLFFLDEADSGLDFGMSYTLFENLRAIADEGRIVVVITHSPDRVREFIDKVVVLAKDTRSECGKLAFFGDVKDSLQYFDVDSVENIVRKINRKNEGGEGMGDYFIDRWIQENRR